MDAGFAEVFSDFDGVRPRLGAAAADVGEDDVAFGLERAAA